MKVKAGRGFSLEELKVAGIQKQLARTIGIAVDHRRRNRSQESIDVNVERLKAYKAQLIIFPRKAGKPKKGDADAATIAEAQQGSTAAAFPITQPQPDLTPRAITSEEKEGSRYQDLRIARSLKKNAGKKAAAEKKAQEEADAKAKK